MIIARTLSRLIQSLSFFGLLVTKLTRHGNVFYRKCLIYLYYFSEAIVKNSASWTANVCSLDHKSFPPFL